MYKLKHFFKETKTLYNGLVREMSVAFDLKPQFDGCCLIELE